MSSEILKNHQTLEQELAKHLTRPTVVVVSKKQPVATLKKLYQLGYRHFAENYLQEALERRALFQDCPDLVWHYIGRIQTNKIKKIAEHFEVIHSISSQKQWELLEGFCLKSNFKRTVFLQVNFQEESSKGGLLKEDVLRFIREQAERRSPLSFAGFMFMTAYEENLTKQEEVYLSIREWVKSLPLASKGEVYKTSMGTSHDYKVALRYGADYIRLGTVLCGKREK